MPRIDSHDPDATLEVTELVSVGLVRAGANGPSDVLITKRRDGDEPRLERVRRRLREILGAGPVDDPDDGWRFEFEKRQNLGEWLEAQLHTDATLRADSLFGEGILTREERLALSSALARALDAYRAALEESAAASLYDRGFGDDVAERVAQAETPDTIEQDSPERRTDQMPDALTLTDEQRGTLDPEVRKYVESLEAAAAEATKTGDPDPDPAAVEKRITDLIEKTADPEIRKALEDQADEIRKARTEAEEARKAADEARKVADEERDRRLAKTYVEKASATPNVVEKADEFGPVLRKIAEALTADEFAMVETTLARADRLVADSSFFREFGAGGGVTPGSAAEKAERLAKARVADGGNITFEQAYDAVLREDHDLARAVDAEERDRSRAGR